MLVTFKTAFIFFQTFQGDEKNRKKSWTFQGNTIGFCESHRDINYNKPSLATRRLRHGLSATYYVSYRRAEFQM